MGGVQPFAFNVVGIGNIPDMEVEPVDIEDIADMEDPVGMADTVDISEDPGVIADIELMIGLLGPIAIGDGDVPPLIEPVIDSLIIIARIAILFVAESPILMPMVDIPIEVSRIDDMFIPMLIVDRAFMPSPVPA